MTEYKVKIDVVAKMILKMIEDFRSESERLGKEATLEEMEKQLKEMIETKI